LDRIWRNSNLDNDNFSPCLTHFRLTTHLFKILIENPTGFIPIPYGPYQWESSWGSPLEFCRDLWHQKSRIREILFGVVCMIPRLDIFDTVRARDRRTDRRTHDDSIYRTSISSRGKSHSSKLREIFCARFLFPLFSSRLTTVQ